MRSLVTSSLVSTQRHYRIRSIFLAPRESYSVGEARRLTGKSQEELRRAISEGELEATEIAPNTWRIPWVSIAGLAVDIWGLEAIEHDMGPKATYDTLPPLVRMAEITLRLPRYQVAMLEVLARRPEMTINNIVADVLLPLAEECIGEMELAITGFTEAIHFPDSEWKKPRSRRKENEATDDTPEG
ncbi:MAG TPA: hypothetical protein VN380_17935 [Thermoanaerobaculia bacterium]|jgi:hypothetical protein|nr:hypothetical protein [Thermoanaerobaculia bacterium]